MTNRLASIHLQTDRGLAKSGFLGTLMVVCAVAFSVGLLIPETSGAIGGKSFIGFTGERESFPLSVSGKSVNLCVSSRDFEGVRLIAMLFQTDIGNVTGVKPVIVLDTLPRDSDVVIIGTIGKNPLVDSLIAMRRIDARGIAGQWESFLVQTVERPFPGVGRALVVAGSDKRGTIYGMFDISEQIGVSPWYWWADVPIKHHEKIFVDAGRHTDGPPAVHYRGIFLNDEAPDLTNWVYAKFGTIPPRQNPPIPPGIANYGHAFYTKLFELILRLRGNYLWPAMWNNAFNEDDPENPRLADVYGIVMGTSHQEPMLRAQKEWDRRYQHTLGSWNYARYPDTLMNFWRAGIRRNRKYESIITVGLRGADDTPMAPGGPGANRTLLEQIVGVQRRILAQEMDPDVTRIPQLWCLYKEVLDFYNDGMRVPDDVTLLWPDDNWGNIRRLPTAEERTRNGGAGIYYHFDYHGGPRSYQWINTNPIPKVWEQLSLAKQYGADRIWIVNVGHLKGYEFPLQFFMDFAWNTERWNGGNLDEYTRLWAEREFGPQYANEIARIVIRSTQLNGRRKPELLSPMTYSLVNYREAERVVAHFRDLTTSAERLYEKLPQEVRNAFYELVLFPTKAGSIVNELYVAAGKNALYAKQGRASANDEATKTRMLFREDTSLMGYFNRSFNDGKWDHFMDQSHLGYTNWQDPPSNSLRAIHLVDVDVPAKASMGIAVEGSDRAWPDPLDSTAALPAFDAFNRRRHFVDVFNRGQTPFVYHTRKSDSWIDVDAPGDSVTKDKRVWIGVDWAKAPEGKTNGTVTFMGPGASVTVIVDVRKSNEPNVSSYEGFVEGEGVVSIEAQHFSQNFISGQSAWSHIEGYGHTRSGMMTKGPVDCPALMPGKDSPCLEYRMFLYDTGTVDVEGIFGPSLNFLPGRPVRYAVSFDDEPPQTMILVPSDYNAQNGNRDWERSVEMNGRYSHSKHVIQKAGDHTLKFWMIDPAVVLEKIVVNLGGLRQSFLGPPESFRATRDHDL